MSARSSCQLQGRLRMQPALTGLNFEKGDKPFEFLHSNLALYQSSLQTGSFRLFDSNKLTAVAKPHGKKLLTRHYIFNTLPAKAARISHYPAK
jgi:hypothetical protein